MRIISGRLGGRQFKSPSGHRTHPMSDKARGALFNVLGDIEGLTVLDVFAGSGALSFEAISRGASFAILIDSDRLAERAIRENVSQLGIQDKTKVIRANVSSWSDRNLDKKFDIVIADPPYDEIKPMVLHKLSQHLTSDGILIISLPKNWPLDDQPVPLRPLEQKHYGDAQLRFYKKPV